MRRDQQLRRIPCVVGWVAGATLAALDLLLGAGAFASLAALGAALVSQHVFGMDPCPWCVLQRLIFAVIAIDLLGTLHAAIGDLNKVKRIVKLMSLVNSAPTFTEQHLVTNGASELMAEVFGSEKGAHARSAFGVAQNPFGACVEIELIAEIE